MTTQGPRHRDSLDRMLESLLLIALLLSTLGAAGLLAQSLGWLRSLGL